jgi:minimal PKS acyl carrier protein
MPNARITEEEMASVMCACAGAQVAAETLRSHPDTTFTDLGVDSLGVLGVVAELENRYGIRVTTDAERCRTPLELQDLVNAALHPEDHDARTH